MYNHSPVLFSPKVDDIKRNQWIVSPESAGRKEKNQAGSPKYPPS